MNDVSDRTLFDARIEWAKTIKGKGGRCPCCHRWGKINARALNSTMARSLIWLTRVRGHEWIDVPKMAPRWLVQTNQLASLRWWDLVERSESHTPEVKHSGLWRTTSQGRLFVGRHISVPKKVYVYDGEVVAKSEDGVMIDGALGKHFDYSEMMADTYDWGAA